VILNSFRQKRTRKSADISATAADRLLPCKQLGNRNYAELMGDFAGNPENGGQRAVNIFVTKPSTCTSVQWFYVCLCRPFLKPWPKKTGVRRKIGPALLLLSLQQQLLPVC